MILSGFHFPTIMHELFLRKTGATGQELITEIQIGQRMLGIIESSARHAQAMEAAARQRQQTYDDG